VRRASWYCWKPKAETTANLALMRQLDEIYTECPWYGSRKLAWEASRRLGQPINRKRVQRLMDVMGIQGIVPKPATSRPAPDHEHYPYLLRGLAVVRSNQVWCSDITYVRMKGSYFYLAAVMDWHSRYVLSWELSNTRESRLCRTALDAALQTGAQPEIFNTDQGSEFTSANFLAPLKERNIQISMDGRGRALDNVFIERLWRSVKYEHVYLLDHPDGGALWRGLQTYFRYYNEQRPHQHLSYQSPATVYRSS
jgi:putative transposase